MPFDIAYHIVILAYSGLLISSLTTPISLKRIETMKDVLESDSYIEMIESASPYNYLKTSNNTIGLAVIEKWRNQVVPEFPDYRDDDLKRIVYHPNTIYFGDDDHIQYKIMAKFSTPSGKSSVYLGKERIQPSGYGFPMTKGSPLRDEISRS
jgi:hypothetical protein